MCSKLEVFSMALWPGKVQTGVVYQDWVKVHFEAIKWKEFQELPATIWEDVLKKGERYGALTVRGKLVQLTWICHSASAQNMGALRVMCDTRGEHRDAGGRRWLGGSCKAAKGCKISEILQLGPKGGQPMKWGGRQHSSSYTDLLVVFLINTPSPI